MFIKNAHLLYAFSMNIFQHVFLSLPDKDIMVLHPVSARKPKIRDNTKWGCCTDKNTCWQMFIKNAHLLYAFSMNIFQHVFLSLPDKGIMVLHPVSARKPKIMDNTKWGCCTEKNACWQMFIKNAHHLYAFLMNIF